MLLKRITISPRKKSFFFTLLMYFILSPFFLLVASSVSHNAGIAHAGAISECKNPIVFEGGNVNNYVKQFAGITDPYLPLDRAGKMLALLVQLDGLYSKIGYGPLGYIYIKTDDGSPYTCSNEKILKRIKGEECCSDGKLQEGRAAILLSGHFQNVNNQIYLLTNVEFLRKGIEETVSIPSGVGGKNQISFIARLPDTMVSFTPRKFTEQQLYQVANAYSDVMYVRKEPNMNATMEKIEPFHIDGFSYYVENVSKGWLKIRSLKHGLPSGWVKVPRDIGGLGLRELLPELHFVDATAVYLQTRIRGAGSQHLEKFKSLMLAFAQRIQGPSDRRALGLLKGMYATLILERAGSAITEKEIGLVSTVAAEIVELLPTSSEARLLAALTQFRAAIQSDGESFARIAETLETDLLKILSTDPANIYVKANLEQLWRLRTSNDKSDWQTDKLTALRERFLLDKRILHLID